MIKGMLAAALLVTAAPALAQVELRREGQAHQLVVKGQPFLMLGGELANSSASSLDYLRPHWADFKAAHMNTVVAPVSWELIEPAEGRFDFGSVDGLIRDARAHDMKLVILWFGSFKNSMSSYAPAWVKRDQARFPRVQIANGEGQEILSAFHPANIQADAKAFAALMAHIKAIDAAQNTVVLVQVENEIGMLPTAREYGVEANRAFAAPVPAELLAHLQANRTRLVPPLRKLWEENGAKASGSWAEVFGRGPAAEEVFTAWHYARYAEAVTAAGKAAYRLPMYANVAFNRPGKLPGEYPSGGPLPHLIDVWKAGAPSLDMLSPDIYFPNFGQLIAHYDRPDNALFIPEANNAGRDEGAAEAFLAFGNHRAIGYSPFAIDDLEKLPKSRLAQGYDVLAQLTPSLLAAQAQGRAVGVKAPVMFDGTILAEPQVVELGGYRFSVSFTDPWTPLAEQKLATHGGMILQVGEDEFLIAGSGLWITPTPVGPGPHIAGIESAWEGRFEAGQWRRGRLLNGDQTHQGRRVQFPRDHFSIQRVRLYRYD
ncbi:DUF5597 domain-containing protein [Sphingomonas sp.]|uniref:GH35 family beta-galactosidase n=1 Tax=Sphingomonas sp. TaxID=28214 RepID=UPI0035C7ECB4